ncbi:MAG: hypothetical protein ACRDJX_10510 [Solirubrobacteraceae bacterium]
MATRTIVTSQPDVECEVCERRLLRGEQPDIFLVAGRRRIVCELCAPRAAHEGWMRETDSQSLSMPPMRARRGRSLFDRLRQVGRLPGPGEDPIAAVSPDPELQHGSYDPFDGYPDAGSIPAARAAPAPAPESEQPQANPEQQALDRDESAALAAAQAGLQSPAAPSRAESLERPSAYLDEAVAIFNASAFPRRVAGVTRSLGAPMVTVRSAEHLSSVVTIVVAWELCWYRYEVDLSEPVVEAQVTGQGTELAELTREDRAPNAAAADSGALVLTDV